MTFDQKNIENTLWHHSYNHLNDHLLVMFKVKNEQ